MRALLLAALMIVGTSAFATYNPSTGTYTVDEHGCVCKPTVK